MWPFNLIFQFFLTYKALADALQCLNQYFINIFVISLRKNYNTMHNIKQMTLESILPNSSHFIDRKTTQNKTWHSQRWIGLSKDHNQ